jgi:Helix-turn-helix domain
VLSRQVPSHLDIDPLLTENEVCAWLSMSLRTLQRKRKAGLIAAIPWNARRYRFRKSEIERFIKAAEQGTVVGFGTDKQEIALATPVTPGDSSSALRLCGEVRAPERLKRRGKPARSQSEERAENFCASANFRKIDETNG